MAGLFEKQAEMFLDARPTYQAEWHKMLAELTAHHSLAWDVGTGNGQATLGTIRLGVKTNEWVVYDHGALQGQPM
ncbi:UNVERIFIED_CONTAM: hypothetical protein Sradi_4129400 [Sesamum radiatum]|uniref:Uncharacterized protein n=1 Tax=Sesamum radiatum TaxID=300843 RepID=A0AAW2P138_SESRA